MVPTDNRRARLRGLALTLGASCALAAFACSSEEPVALKRVLQPKEACALRAGWNPSPTLVCNDCLSYSRQASCLCPASQDFGGACEAENTKVQQNPECTVEVVACAGSCQSDCECVDRCFAMHPACKSDFGATATCVADTCAKYCE